MALPCHPLHHINIKAELWCLHVCASRVAVPGLFHCSIGPFLPHISGQSGYNRSQMEAEYPNPPTSPHPYPSLLLCSGTRTCACTVHVTPYWMDCTTAPALPHQRSFYMLCVPPSSTCALTYLGGPRCTCVRWGHSFTGTHSCTAEGPLSSLCIPCVRAVGAACA